MSYLSESALEKFLLGWRDGPVELFNGFLVLSGRINCIEQLKDEIIVDQVGLGYPSVVGGTPYGSVRLSHCGGVGTRGSENVEF